MKHTPGPWELSEGETSVWAKSPLNARVRIANIVTHSPMNGIDFQANACLIAAAPSLLEALRAAHGKLLLLNALQTAHVCNQAIKKAMGNII